MWCKDRSDSPPVRSAGVFKTIWCLSLKVNSYYFDILCLCMCMSTLVFKCITDVRGQLVGVCSHQMGPGIELRSPGLVANVFWQ